MVQFDKEIYLSLIFKFILSERLCNSLWVSDIVLFPGFILYYIFIKCIILLHTILVFFFTWYREYMIWCISFNKFLDALTAFTCVSAIGNPWSNCLGVSILITFPCNVFNGNIPFLKALRVNSHPHEKDLFFQKHFFLYLLLILV